MRILMPHEEMPDDASDFAVGIPTNIVAWVTNRRIVLDNGHVVVVPAGWEAVLRAPFIFVYFDHEASEVANA